MQTVLQTLTAHVTEAVRRNFGAYLPSSALTGLGQAGELAAQHPAFAVDAEDTRRSA